MELNSLFSESMMVQTGITIMKGFMLLISLIYLTYAVVFSRRIKIMNQNLKTGYEKGFNRLSKFHIFLSLVSTILFILSIIY